jgi:hypothetical protein
VRVIQWSLARWSSSQITYDQAPRNQAFKGEDEGTGQRAAVRQSPAIHDDHSKVIESKKGRVPVNAGGL